MKKIRWRGHTLELELTRYANGRVALQLWSAEGMPYARPSVNLPEVKMANDEVAIKDFDENQGLLDALVKAGVLEPTERFARSGYCQYPICRLVGGAQ